MIRIDSNGSKWKGEAPDDLPALFERLARYPLNPEFEEYGNFVIPKAGCVRFWGNFYTLSAVFSVDTDETDTIAKLTAAIRANQASNAYREARLSLFKFRAKPAARGRP